jgi:hypothetical protein
MSFSWRTDGPDGSSPAAVSSEKGDFRLLEVCTDAEQRLMAGFFNGWIANMRLKNLAYAHFRKALIRFGSGKSYACSTSSSSFLFADAN